MLHAQVGFLLAKKNHLKLRHILLKPQLSTRSGTVTQRERGLISRQSLEQKESLYVRRSTTTAEF
ncbi:hypothetical protein J6590_099450 [Homalodisca vitripennis]|nr:hypothetical protein J6590_099450 [Homalodisca vitripennis]